MGRERIIDLKLKKLYAILTDGYSYNFEAFSYIQDVLDLSSRMTDRYVILGEDVFNTLKDTLEQYLALEDADLFRVNPEDDGTTLKCLTYLQAKYKLAADQIKLIIDKRQGLLLEAMGGEAMVARNDKEDAILMHGKLLQELGFSQTMLDSFDSYKISILGFKALELLSVLKLGDNGVSYLASCDSSKILALSSYYNHLIWCGLQKSEISSIDGEKIRILAELILGRAESLTLTPKQLIDLDIIELRMLYEDIQFPHTRSGSSDQENSVSVDQLTVVLGADGSESD